MPTRRLLRGLLVPSLALCALLAGGATTIVQDQCGPFTDVTPGFCPYVLELYYLGITAGTSATTFSPEDPLTRGQAAVFIAKGLNQSLARSSRRAALGQWWTTTPHYDGGLGVTAIPAPMSVVADGADLWVTTGTNSIYRVRASDGAVLGIWSAPGTLSAVLVAMGRVFVVGFDNSFVGFFAMLDPSQPPGAVTVIYNGGVAPGALAFDGTHIWVSDGGIPATAAGDLVMVTPTSSLPWDTTTIQPPCGGCIRPSVGDVFFDGSYVWAIVNRALSKFDTNGNFLFSEDFSPQSPAFIAFDGANLWVSLGNTEVKIVRPSTGDVIATLSGNGLQHAGGMAFDGERMLITNSPDGVSLFRAADFAPLGSFSTGAGSAPSGICSDGINFWLALFGTGQLARF